MCKWKWGKDLGWFHRYLQKKNFSVRRCPRLSSLILLFWNFRPIFLITVYWFWTFSTWDFFRHSFRIFVGCDVESFQLPPIHLSSLPTFRHIFFFFSNPGLWGRNDTGRVVKREVIKPLSDVCQPIDLSQLNSKTPNPFLSINYYLDSTTFVV